MRLVGAGLSLALGLSGAARALLSAHATYSLGLWALSSLLPRDPDAGPARNPPPRIAVLVVAHDEGQVVDECVRSLVGQRYARDRFDVFVVADNCSDDTATRARSAGATVLERCTGRPEGKPAAVAFGVEHIVATAAYDAVALFDADNVVDGGFLEAISRRIAAGERVVQGFVDAKNPDVSLTSAASAIGFWAIDGIVQRPRERLRLSAALMGTGFAAQPGLFSSALAPGGSLTDDLEGNALLALRGVRVAYEPDARTFDEKPTSMAASVAQRRRWMQGRWTTVERWLPALAARVALPRAGTSMLERVRAFDVAVQLVAPSLLFSATALGTLAGGELVIRGLAGRGAVGSAARGARRALGLAAVCFMAPLPAVARQRPAPRVWLAYALQPAFLLRSVPLAVGGYARRRDPEWVRTRHGDG